MEEIKNNRSVEMSDEEFAEFQAFRQEQARQAAEARVEKLRTNYGEMAEAFISRTIKKLTPLSEQIRRKKAEVLEEAEVLQRLKAELLEIDGKQMPKSHTFTNAAGDKRVTIGVYETDGYDDTVEEGIAIVKEYIESLASDQKSPRHLQEDYEGAMNVLIGAEFGYSDDKSAQAKYQAVIEKYSPDFIINSVHGEGGKDYIMCEFTGDKATVYREYLALIRRSLDAPYPYDIVGHIGYVARYVPFENKEFCLSEFGKEIDDILTTIIQKGKILEVNSSNKKLPQRTLPAENILRRYFELGGRMISFGSDAHDVDRILDKREEVTAMLKNIGFTYLTVPCRGEYIKVEI